MFRAVDLRGVSLGWAHFLVVLFVVALLLSVDGLVPARVDASALSRQVSATRQSQSNAAKRMRRADHKLKVLRHERRSAGRSDKPAIRKIRKLTRKRAAARKRLRKAEARLEIATLDLARKLRVHPNPKRFHAADKPKARKQLRKLEARTRVVRKKTGKIEHATAKAKKTLRVRRHRRGRYGELIAAKIKQRETAERLLATRIARMVDLAALKVVRKTRATPASSGLKRPARGHISQRYGCTRIKSKRSRTCTYFHDGIDIATHRGALVRASADGIVAYAGFSPWDKQKRAFIVIIAHRGGLQTIYAHMRPKWRVRPGEFVQRGQTIGYVGTTGHTTGPHVHWEAVRNGRRIDPLSFR